MDYWNGLLKQKVTERRRDNHREAKDNFLRCLGESNKQRANNKKVITSNSARRDIYTLTPRAVRRSSNITVSSYHNFTGAKLIAWNQFFQESRKCKNNSGDMAVFVECSKTRKDFLKRFNKLWDEKQQKLRSPLQ